MTLTSLFFSNKHEFADVIFVVDDVIIMGARVVIDEGAHLDKLVRSTWGTWGKRINQLLNAALHYILQWGHQHFRNEWEHLSSEDTFLTVL